MRIVPVAPAGKRSEWAHVEDTFHGPGWLRGAAPAGRHGWIAGPELAEAVAEAGGLGMLCMPMVPAAAFSDMLSGIRSGTNGRIGVTFPLPFLDIDFVPVAARLAHVVEFSYGQPDPNLVRLAHSGGALVSWQVGSVGDALAAAEAACDVIVAQGRAPAVRRGARPRTRH